MLGLGGFGLKMQGSGLAAFNWCLFSMVAKTATGGVVLIPSANPAGGVVKSIVLFGVRDCDNPR